MHNHHVRVKAVIISLFVALMANFAFASPHQTEAKNTKGVVEAKQELKKKVHNANKANKAKKDHKHQEEEVQKPIEPKKPEVKKEVPPPAPVTPDKKKYASPGGNQVMADGTIIDFCSIGIIYMHGYRYSYYSSKVLRHHKTHEWYACDDHIYRTTDGYIVVAAKNKPMGAIVPTPFGKGKVLDYCYVDNTIDIYVDF